MPVEPLAAPLSSAPVTAERGAAAWLLCAALALTSCAGSDAASGDEQPGVVAATSAARAQARKEREARSKAKAEQKPDKSARPTQPSSEAAPKTAPVPSSTASAKASATPVSSAAATATAAASASASANLGLPEGPVCPKLCERVVTCAASAAADANKPERVGAGSQPARASCEQACGKKLSEGGPRFVSGAKACLALADCDALMSCVNALRKR